jgi:hypothetical protein
MHLVARVVERAQLDPTVEGVVSDLLLGDQSAIATTRRIVRQSSWPTLAQRLQAMNADPASLQRR